MALRSLVSVLAGVLLTAGAAGCGSPADDTGDSGPPASPSTSSQSPGAARSEDSAAAGSPEPADADPVVITIKDFEFNGPESVAPGATVMVVNEDRSSHTLTSEADDFDEVVLKGGADGTFTAPTEPGSYDYVCAYHPEMTGTLVVK